MKESKGSPRTVALTSKKSAKYRNPKGPAKYFAAYKKEGVQEEDVSPEEVEVSVGKIKHTLNSKIWSPENKLNPEVKKALLKIAQAYFDTLELDIKIKDIYFTGSLANYNWTESSDIDLHLIIDYSEVDDDADFIEDYLYLKKKAWVDSHRVGIYGFEVEPFAKNKEAKHEYKAIYSILNDKWVVKPTKDVPPVDFQTIREKSASLMTKIESLADIRDVEKRAKAAEKLKEKLSKLRADGLKKGGEYSNENLVFKTLRRSGHLEMLSNLKNLSVDTMLSLNESVVSEKAKSKKQQRFFGMVDQCQKTGKCPSKSVKDAADSMKKSDVEDFASTKHKGLPEKVKEGVINKSNLKHKLTVEKGIPGMTDEKVDVIKDFISFVCSKLGMESPVDVHLKNGRSETIATTASYLPQENQNHIRCGNRALVDILRSIAHELTHNRQREMGKFNPGDAVQNIGGHIEDEANSIAGIFIKDFTHNYGYDNIYDI